MKPLIHILHLEDDPNDVELVRAKLEKAGLTCQVTAVQARDKFEEALRQNEYDIILADFRLPNYDGMSALRLAQEFCPDVPFVFVSGVLGEEAAIEGLKQGATDYVLKHNPLRLVPAVQRALQEAENQRERKLAQNELQRSNEMLQAIIEAAPLAIYGLDLDGHVHSVWNPTAQKMFGWSAQEVMGRSLPIVSEEGEEEFWSLHDQMLSGKTLEGIEVRLQRRDGSLIDCSIYASPLYDTKERITGMICLLVDITERKQAERERLENLRFFENMDKVNRAIQGADDLEQMMSNVLDETITIFDSDRAFLMYPCDPESPTWTVPMERTRPEYPGVLELNLEVPMDPQVEKVLRILLAADGPVAFGPGTPHALPEDVSKQFGLKSLMSMVILPKIGSPWEFGIQQCRFARRWTSEEMRLFEAIGRRLSDGLSSWLSHRDLRKSEEEKTILNQIANIFLTIPDEAMYGEVLKIVLQVMKSKFGIFGYIGETGDLIIPSMTRDIWKECRVLNKSMVFPQDSWGNSLWGRSIREKKVFFSDGPFHTPEGHIPIDHFLTVPIVYGNETIGLISVANGQQSYTEEDGNMLLSIADHISPILNARLQRDWEERKRERAEETLRKLSHALEQSPASIVITDTAGDIEYVNPKFTEVTGYAKIEVLGKNPRILQSGELPKEFYKQLWKTITSGKDWHGEFHNRKKSGELYWESASISPIFDTSGAITHFVAVKEDITERKRLEAQFRQAQKMESVGRLAGGVAHDFNNMLGVIIGHVELAMDRLDPDQPLYDDLIEIRKAADHSADLTRQLLAFARKQTVAPRVLDLNETIEGMLKILRRLIGEDINLSWLPGTEMWPVKMDPSQIDQILANLCVNARDAIAGVGKVTIETKTITFDEVYCADHPEFVPGEYVLLSMSDDGCGIDKETLDKLFEPFFTTKGVGKGTGLGLSTVYGIVKQNNGFINVYSEPGIGSTFKIYLPRHTFKDDQIPKESLEIPVARGHETILLVEDESAMLKMGRLMLERLGYRVLAESTPGEAIRVAKEYAGEIHLIITDVVMPEMNGRDLAKTLIALYPGLKHLFMSGYTGNIIVHHGVLDKGENFIQKPFSMQALAAKVREVLDVK